MSSTHKTTENEAPISHMTRVIRNNPKSQRRETGCTQTKEVHSGHNETVGLGEDLSVNIIGGFVAAERT